MKYDGGDFFYKCNDKEEFDSFRDLFSRGIYASGFDGTYNARCKCFYVHVIRWYAIDPDPWWGNYSVRDASASAYRCKTIAEFRKLIKERCGIG